MDSQQNKDANSNQPTGPHFAEDRGGRILGGVIVIAVGGALLASRLGVELPRWLFHWAMIPIIIGIYVGARHKFRSFGWLIPVAIGTVLLIDDYTMLSIRDYVWPMVIILVGFAIMFKPKNRRHWRQEYWDKRQSRWTNVTDVNPIAETKTASTSTDDSNSTTPSPGYDLIDSVTIFGSLKKIIISKNFLGGDAVTIFGGTELNMLQADINGQIVLELTQVFAGAKLVVPPHWRIQTTDVVSIFGGVEDKRPLPAEGTSDGTKIIIIKGVCLFGGIDIKSF